MDGEATVVGGALDRIALSKARMLENQRLLSETRHRIAASRRRLNRMFAVAGGVDEADGPQHDPDLLDRVIRAVHDKKLPARQADALRGGRGVGAACSVCERPVRDDETQLKATFRYDGEPATVYLVHVRCYAAWLSGMKGSQDRA